MVTITCTPWIWKMGFDNCVDGIVKVKVLLKLIARTNVLIDNHAYFNNVTIIIVPDCGPVIRRSLLLASPNVNALPWARTHNADLRIIHAGSSDFRCATIFVSVWRLSNIEHAPTWQRNTLNEMEQVRPLITIFSNYLNNYMNIVIYFSNEWL